MKLVRAAAAAIVAAAGWFLAAPAHACAPVTVYFDWNSAELNEQSRAALERLALALAWKQPDLEQIRLTSHTDGSGSAAANRAIALRRARAVRDLLVANQVPARLFRIEAVGAASPRVRAGRNAREPYNRRVELLLQMSAEAQGRQLANGAPIC